MTRKIRTFYGPDFKFQVALESVHTKLTMKKLAKKYNINVGVIYLWRKNLLKYGHRVFENTQIDPRHSNDEKIVISKNVLLWVSIIALAICLGMIAYGVFKG